MSEISYDGWIIVMNIAAYSQECVVDPGHGAVETVICAAEYLFGKNHYHDHKIKPEADEHKIVKSM